VCVQGMHQRGAFQNNANPRVAMAVNPPLMTLGQAKPPLQIEVVLDLHKHAFAHEQAGEKADHHLGHLFVNRVPGLLESLDQSLELRPPIVAGPYPRFEGRGDFLDVLGVLADRLLLDAYFVSATVDAGGESAELLLCESPFFASRFRWSDARTSSSASAICKPGGWSGPP
jgi:hypothetical protein